MSQQGEKHHKAVLTDKKIEKIRKLYFMENNSLTQVQLSKIYGVAQQHISRIVGGRAWKHLL